MTSDRSAFHLAYYELHELPWLVAPPIKLRDETFGFQFELGVGPYWVPNEATPRTITVAGGARIETVHENYQLEGGTFFGVAAPIEWELPGNAWESSSTWADDCAGIVGLCLNQRFALKKRAEYVSRREPDGTPAGTDFRWKAYPAGRASISKRSVASTIRALDLFAARRISPQTLTALRWYEQSKRVEVGVDRLVALWIALEALVPKARNHAELVNAAATELTKPAYRLSDNAEIIANALGLWKIREYRNAIVHEGSRDFPWPTDEHSLQRDWPQILNDVVAEILRNRFHATPTREINGHFKKGMELLG